MFKKPPTLKPSTPLRSSSRRAFLAHLQALYPVLASAPVEKILQVVPNGLKQCIAITSAGQKAVIYTDDKGKPLWFELGVNAGAALQQAQKKSSQGSQSKLAEVFPTVYTLWILPNLLPRLPTWPQVMDPTLLSGSALMIPGLIPPPDTYPEAEVKVYPPSNSIISITAYPSPVPLVVARSELDMKELCQKRSLGERGKAATAIHTKGDYLWEMGGKLSPPSQEEVKKIEEELAAAKVTDEPHELEQQVEDLDLEETQGNIASSEVADNGSMPENPAPKADKISGPSFTAAGEIVGCIAFIFQMLIQSTLHTDRGRRCYVPGTSSVSHKLAQTIGSAPHANLIFLLLTSTLQ
jgi:predicted ribosome-associated RNA-binding protein Tma20